jgi:hypothetical protein
MVGVAVETMVLVMTAVNCTSMTVARTQ